MLDENRLQKPRSQRGWMLSAAAALIVIVGGAFALTRLGDGDGPVVTTSETPVTSEAPINNDDETVTLTDTEPPSAPVFVVVPGNEQWTDTGLDLSIGDTVLIGADGTVNPAAPSFPVNGPDGNHLAGLTKVELEESNHAGLIGRIGEAGAPFWVGSRHLSKANTEGRLFLGINDGLVENNAGEFTATITINPDDAASTLAVAESYIVARNAYDGEAVEALFIDDAFIRDDLQRDANGIFLGIDEIDFVFNADFERVTGVRHVEATCALGSPSRVRCTYTWENAWSQALGDDRYTDNIFVFDISEGQIESLTHTFAQGPVDGFENHISEVTLQWLVTNHPDDVSTMYDSGLPRATGESLGRWRSYTQLFVLSTTQDDDG